MTAHIEHQQLGVDATRLLRRAVGDYAVDDALLTISRAAARQLAGGLERHGTLLAGYRLAMVVRALLEEDAGPADGARRLKEADLGMLCDLAAAGRHISGLRLRNRSSAERLVVDSSQSLPGAAGSGPEPRSTVAGALPRFGAGASR